MTSLRQQIDRQAQWAVDACSGCRECLHHCPVAGPQLRIADLNAAVRAPQAASAQVTLFVDECFQCGLCVPVCPAGVSRETMTLWQKSVQPTPAPVQSQLATLARNGWVGRLGRVVQNTRQRTRLGAVGAHLDKRRLEPADTLFFFGCNAMSESGLADKVLALADYLGTRYEVLAGTTACCGASHLAAGELDQAEQMMVALYDRIVAHGPMEVVTIGSACYSTLRRLVAIHGESFTPVTSASWIRRNLHRFPVQRRDGIYTFHDACFVSRKHGEGEEARRVLRQFGCFVEMAQTGDAAPCCGAMQMDVNPAQLARLRSQRIAEASEVGADTLVVECVRCQEAYAPAAEAMGVRVVDVVDLVYDALMADQGPKAQPVQFKSPPLRGQTAPAEGT